MSYKAIVVGASGFAGIELVRILTSHPNIELVAAISDSYESKLVSSLYPAFATNDKTMSLTFSGQDALQSTEADIVFLAVPHTASLSLTPQLIEANKVVIDLSADYRLKDTSTYEQWYSTPHTSEALLAQAAFGLPELKGEEIEEAARQRMSGKGALVACAGCYPTATSLACAPIIENGWADVGSTIVADAISGVTGAGRKPSERTHFCNANDNLEAYGVASHRHTPEIEQILGIEGRLVFTPHLAPLNRGLLSTVTIPISEAAKADALDPAKLHEAYKDFYANSHFVTVLDPGQYPKTSSVVGTNNAVVGCTLDLRTDNVIAVCAIDNLGKGAAGQAVQCCNMVCGLEENAGLSSIAQPI